MIANMDICSFCMKECKGSDSRPHPKTKQLIHNKCFIKMKISGKKPKCGSASNIDESKSKPDARSSEDIMNRLIREEQQLTESLNERKLVDDRLNNIETIDTKSGQFFFDLKAGIAKPNEKRQVLHHRKTSEFAARFDDQGFVQEAAGRSYDHTGANLDTIGYDSDSSNSCRAEHDEDEYESKIDCNALLAKHFNKRRNNASDYSKANHHRSKKRPRFDNIGTNSCWFCLSSPKVERYLILAVGEHCYLALAKGGLVDEHMLIVPKEHIDSQTNRANTNEIKNELEQFKRSLVDYHRQHNKSVIFFERSYQSVHWQLQVIPLPNDWNIDIERNIKNISKKFYDRINYIDITQGCSLEETIPPGVPYFYWQVEPSNRRFVSQLQIESCKFPVQFGRMVLSFPSLLNCTDKIDWRKCVETEADYEKLVADIKERYSEFDFTQERSIKT